MAAHVQCHTMRAALSYSAEGIIWSSIAAGKPASSVGSLRSRKVLSSAHRFDKLRVVSQTNRSWRDNHLGVSASLKPLNALKLQNEANSLQLGPYHAPNWYAGVDNITLEDSIMQNNLPIIDFAGINGTERPQIIGEVGRALEEYCFFYAINHGVGHIEKLESECKKFFELPLEEKMLYMANPGIRTEGYYNFKVTNFKESPGFWKETLRCKTLPPDVRDLTKWPPQVRQTILDSSLDYAAFCQSILTIISESLGLPPSYINDSITEPTTAFVPTYYQARNWEKEGEPNPISLVAHTDISLITVIAQENVSHPALQYLLKGEWVNCKPIPNSLIVVTGDQLEVLSNGRYISGIHRVMTSKDVTRFSNILGYGNSNLTRVFPAPKLIDEAHPQLYREYLVEERIQDVYVNGKVLDKEFYLLQKPSSEPCSS